MKAFFTSLVCVAIAILALAATDALAADFTPGGFTITPADLPATAEQPDLSPAYAGAGGTISGTAYLPVVLVDFADNPAESSLHTPQAFADMFFQVGYPYGAGSVRDFYRNQSGGVFDVTGQVTQWLRMPKSYSTYVGGNTGMQNTEPNDFTLIRDAAAAADASTNYCTADRDGDNYVDALFVIHAGAGAEEGKVSSRLWSVRWQLPAASVYTTQDTCANGVRVKIRDFTIEPEEFATSGYSAPGAPDRIMAIGVICHEFGHALGLPDLYDTDSSTAGGVGAWDIMASGSWGFSKPWRPSPFGAWSKLQLGWATAQNVTANQFGVAIPSVDAPRSGVFTGIYRLAAGGSASSSEYYLVENRQQTGYAADFPGGGLLIWHIDDSVSGNANDARRQVSVVQADGLDELGTQGGRANAGDLFPGTSNIRLLSDTTNPSTRSYSGAATNITVRSIGTPGATTSADLLITTATAGDTTAPVVGAVNKQYLSAGLITSTTVPVELTWSGTDNVGVTAYEVWYRIDGGTWTKDANVGSLATSVKYALSIGHTHQLAVRARDAAGNWSAYSYSNTIKPAVTDDRSFGAMSTWTQYTLADTFGGTYTASKTAGAWLQYTGSGRDLALAAVKFSTAGRASVYCDGLYSGMVDGYSATTAGRVVLARCHFSQSASHTMKIVVEGTSGRPWFGFDAFSVLG